MPINKYDFKFQAYSETLQRPTLSVLENYLIKNYVNDDKTKNKGGNESKKRLRKLCTQVLSLLKKAFCKHDENWRSITKN